MTETKKESNESIESPNEVQRVAVSPYEWQLRAVRLYEAAIDRFPSNTEAQEPEEGLPLAINIDISAAESRVSGRLTVIHVYPNEDTPQFKMRVAIDGILTPESESTAVPKKERLVQELGPTILLLLWPYAREFMHDLMRRMEVDVRLLPTLDRLDLEKRIQTLASDTG